MTTPILTGLSLIGLVSCVKTEDPAAAEVQSAQACEVLAVDTAIEVETPDEFVPEFGATNAPALTVVATVDDGLSTPRDLEFHPDRTNELWTVNQATDSVVILFDPGTTDQIAETRHDAYGRHFMEEVSALAFGANDTFATTQESDNTYCGASEPNEFMGPTLWPADLDIFAVANQDGENDLLGSHLDMLHESPFAMGIAHYRDNAYWVFDGHYGQIVYYDFQDPHEVGGEDHSDGIVRRYARDEDGNAITLKRVENVPGHMDFDDATGMLYVADTGNARILCLDTASGTRAGTPTEETQRDTLAEYSEYEDVAISTLVSAGITEPSGLLVHAGRLFVTDAATGEIIAFDAETGQELQRITTDATQIMGITMGPDGQLWYVDGGADLVVRVDP